MDITAGSRAPGWRRIVAYFIDYVVFILPLLIVLTLAGTALSSLAVAPTLRGWTGHSAMLVLLTLPVALYFALSESSQRKATVGKRAMKLVVGTPDGEHVSFGHAFLRAAGKLAPWEFFHAMLWHWEGWPMNPSPATTLQVAGLVFGWAMVGVYLASLFLGSGRTPYDALAGTSVLYRRPQA